MLLTAGERDKVIAAATKFVEQRDGVQIDECAWTHENYDLGHFEIVVADSCRKNSTILLRMLFHSADEALKYFEGQERLL